jgi:hypothetical protein
MLCYPTSMSDLVKKLQKSYDDETIQGYLNYLQKHKKNQNKGVYGKDSEKTKTYKCEWAFQREYQVKQFNTIAEAQKRCDQITKSPTWKKLREEKGRQNAPSIWVKSKARNTGRKTAGWASGNTITLDMIVGLDEYTLIHEMTHCLGNWHHGRSFRRDLLKLVSRFMGRDASNILKSKFKENKLACGEPRKPMEFEQWLSTKERMAKMRSAL